MRSHILTGTKRDSTSTVNRRSPANSSSRTITVTANLNGPHRNTRRTVLSPVFNPFLPRTIGTVFGQTAGIAADAYAPGSGGFVQGFIDSVINILGGGPSRWVNTPAGSDVHNWFHYGPDGNQAFQDWLDANYPDVFGSLDAVLALAPAFLKQQWDVFITPANSYSDWYREGATRLGYEGMGIDIDATVAASTPGQRPVWKPLLNPVRGGTGGGRGGGAGTQTDDGTPPTPSSTGSGMGLLVAAGIGLYLLNK